MQVVVIQLFDIPSTLLQLATRMATFIGSILAFDNTLEDWPPYVKRADQFIKKQGERQGSCHSVTDLDGQPELQVIAKSGRSAEAARDVLHRHSGNLDEAFGA